MENAATKKVTRVTIGMSRENGAEIIPSFLPTNYSVSLLRKAFGVKEMCDYFN